MTRAAVVALVLAAVASPWNAAGQERGRPLAAAAQPRTLSIAGALGYRQRIALPPDSRVVVELREMAATLGTSLVESRFATGGRQVPFAFELVIDRAALVPGRRYGLRGGIESNGRLVWVTEPVAIDRSASAINLGTLNLTAVRSLPSAAGPAVPQVFRAVGQEPGWRLEISGSRLTLMADYGRTNLVRPVRAPEVTGDTTRYVASSPSGDVTVTVVDRPCADAMSGMPYPRTVTVALPGRTLTGCGGEPASMLQGATWVVVDLNGTAVGDRARITMAFGADGRVSGQAGCNGYSGEYVLTGEGLVVSKVAATTKACLDPLMRQERLFLGLLDATRRFSRDPEGRLRLHTGDGRTLTARRE